MLVAGGTTIIGVAVGAGLTYWFNTLNRRHQEAREDRNRRHQEAREDRTRWYEARREAYASMLMAVSLYHRTWTAQADEGGELTEKGLNELAAAVHGVRLVGSPAAVGAANNLLRGPRSTTLPGERDGPAQVRAGEETLLRGDPLASSLITQRASCRNYRR